MDKALAARRFLPAGARVLAADTAVVLDGEVLGKPRDEAHAAATLARLSGRQHQVFTGVALAGDACRTRLSESRVRFRSLSAAERTAYVATGEPMDKAGAYAIQGRAAVFIEHLDGSYSGVMGLPIYETAQLLHEAGIEVLR
jgi:septum formation protein